MASKILALSTAVLRIWIRSDPVLCAGSGSGQKQPDLDPDSDPDPASIIAITLRRNLNIFDF